MLFARGRVIMIKTEYPSGKRVAFTGLAKTRESRRWLEARHGNGEAKVRFRVSRTD